MSKFTKDQLKTLQKLCRIRLDAAEEESLRENLNKILASMDSLSEVDTENVEPCRHVIENTEAPLREDIPQRLIPREKFLEGAPSHVGGMIKVPPIIQEAL